MMNSVENLSLQTINSPNMDFFPKILFLVHDIHFYNCFQYMNFSALQTSLKLTGASGDTLK